MKKLYNSILKKLFKSFINSTEKSLDIPEGKPLTLYKELLKKLGWELEIVEDNTNGWQIDFWYYFLNPNYDFKLELSGSLWEGDYKLIKIYD